AAPEFLDHLRKLGRARRANDQTTVDVQLANFGVKLLKLVRRRLRVQNQKRASEKACQPGHANGFHCHCECTFPSVALVVRRRKAVETDCKVKTVRRLKFMQAPLQQSSARLQEDAAPGRRQRAGE